MMLNMWWLVARGCDLERGKTKRGSIDRTLVKGKVEDQTKVRQRARIRFFRVGAQNADERGYTVGGCGEGGGGC